MSRIHRAVEKADREGLLTWTRGEDEARGAAVLEDAPRPSPREAAEDSWTSELPIHRATERPNARTPDPPDYGTTERPNDRTTIEPPVWEIQGTPEVALSHVFVAATEPGSPASEQYRLLRTRVEKHEGDRRTQFMLVTSPLIGDGKTTTSANLALTMAQEFQQRVVLVEADLRRPMLAGLFGVRPEPGLVDVLVGVAALDDALVEVPGQRLFLLPGGLAAARSTELLASSMMHRLVQSLRSRFDRIVVDTPPVALADTHVLARVADGILLVVRSGVTPRPAVERAVAAVDRERLIGIVLNEVDDAPTAYAAGSLQRSGAGM
jgi:non-specific protein-tyrosine kinase